MLLPNPSAVPRFPLALAVSLLLHAAVLGWPGHRAAVSARPATLEAHLLPLPPTPTEPLLKNTLVQQQEPVAPAPARARPPPRTPGAHGTRAARLDKSREEAALRKLAKHQFYPDEAVEQGLEGEVRLLLVLDPAGRVLSVDIAAGSGHAILDRAAVAAARAMGSLPDAGVRDFILPVVFRLQ